jgi:hypothetical protein
MADKDKGTSAWTAQICYGMGSSKDPKTGLEYPAATNACNMHTEFPIGIDSLFTAVIGSTLIVLGVFVFLFIERKVLRVFRS